MSEPIRLQKVLAAAGLGSRRACEVLIDEARVSVNGRIVTKQGTRVDPDADTIRVDGSRIPTARRHVYLALNKPAGVVSSMSDDQGRDDLSSLLRRRKERLFHVGRLDTETDGLILLTNDGELANKLTHPRYEVPKTYLAQVGGRVSRTALGRLTTGIDLDDGPIAADKAAIVQAAGERTLVRITLHSGRNRIVRRMFDAIDHPVLRLSRISIGPVTLGQLAPGEHRDLTRQEVGELLDLVES